MGKDNGNREAASRPGDGQSGEQPLNPNVDLSWKEGGSSYPKSSSRVGHLYQAAHLPRAGEYKHREPTGEAGGDNGVL